MNNMNLTRPLSFEISPQRITNIPEIGSSYKRYVGKSQSLPISLSPNHSQTFMSQHSSPCSSEVILTRGELCPCDDYEKYEKVCTEPDCKHQEQSCWNLSRVKIFPSYFNLEKSHEYITDISAAAISENISDCLKRECLEVVYDHDEVRRWLFIIEDRRQTIRLISLFEIILLTLSQFSNWLIQATAYCETSKDTTRPDYCKFQVRIFKAPSQSNVETSPTIIVEVQRRTGCCIKFCSVARKILAASKGCPVCKDEIPNYTIPDYLIKLIDQETSPMMTVAWWKRPGGKVNNGQPKSFENVESILVFISCVYIAK